MEIPVDPGSNPGRAIRNIFILFSPTVFMEVGLTLFIVAILIIAVWVIIEMKRFRHKLLAIFLIALILFTYISFSVTLKGKDIDYKSISGLTSATKLYFSWLGSIFTNIKTITTNAINMKWGSNITIDS